MFATLPSSAPAPALDRFSRRELNHARVRIDLLAAAMNLARDQGLDGVPVDEITSRAGVSRMTFFNRFPEKDALWLYCLWVWWFEGTIEQTLAPLEGLPAIRRDFRRVASADREHRRLFRGFIGYLSRMRYSPEDLERQRPTPAEKALLRPDLENAADITIVPMHRSWRRHLEEAVASGELAQDAPVEVLATDLGVALYGEFLMAIVVPQADLGERFERHLDRIFSQISP